MKALLLTVLLLTSCATPDRKHTQYRDEILEQQAKLHQDARAFLAKAEDILRDKNSSAVDMKRALDIIDKSQTLLGSTSRDEQKLRDVPPEQLDAVVDKIFTEDQKTIEKVDSLEEKDRRAVEEVVAAEMKQRAILDDQRANRRKWYAILASLVSVIGIIIYFLPSGVISSTFNSIKLIALSVFKRNTPSP